MKTFLTLAVLMLAAVKARADMPVYEVGYSTFIVVGVELNSAPAGATLINSRPAGFAANIGRLRLTNPHPLWDIFVGDVNVSTDSFSGNVGHLIKANGGTVDWPVAKDYKRSGLPVPVYARPADSASVDRLPRLSVTWFGF